MSRLMTLIVFNMMLIFVSFCPPAAAQGTYTIKEMTPQVQAALDNRRGRFERLQALKQAGKVGENNRGYVRAFSDEADIPQLVEAENQDRLTIYQTIAEQNNLAGAMETIEKVFAQTQRDKALPGDKIQLEDGTWSTK